jgi:Cdc6-like AAA superfamily ATPase
VDEKHTRAIRAAAGEFMDLHHVSLEWSTPHAAHRTASFRAVRNAALNAMRSGSAYLVDGPPGTEKTFSLRSVEREINDGIEGRAVYVYARAEHRPQSFLRECCLSAGIPANGYIDDLLRQLLDLPPFFGVILSGSHDLTQRLAHWQMEQWRSRLRKTLYLNGPTQAEARQILRAELGEIDDQACDETIAECQASAQRIETVHGKTVSKSFSYTSARDLFGAIERTRELMAQSTQKAGAA